MTIRRKRKKKKKEKKRKKKKRGEKRKEKKRRGKEEEKKGTRPTGSCMDFSVIAASLLMSRAIAFHDNGNV